MPVNRLVSFTMLALASFAILAVRGYWLGCEIIFETAFNAPEYCKVSRALEHFWLLLFPVSAIVPLTFLILAVHTPARRFGHYLNNPWFLMTSLALGIVLALSHWVGRHDAAASFMALNAENRDFPGSGVWRSLSSELAPHHRISWFAFLVPIAWACGLVIFTTAWSARHRQLFDPTLTRLRFRRFLLTMLSLTLYCTAAYLIYDTAQLIAGARDSEILTGPLPWELELGRSSWFACGAAFAVIPFAPLSLSVHGSRRGVVDPWLLVTGLVWAGAFGLCAVRGTLDHRHEPVRHEMSWIILATCLSVGLLLIGAWRRAELDGLIVTPARRRKGLWVGSVGARSS